MKLLDDTHPDARRVLIEAYRRIPPARRWTLLDDAYRLGRSLHASGYRDRHPGATPLDIHLDWIRLTLGERFVQLFPKEGIVIDLTPEQTRVTLEAIAVLQKLGIPYAVGGSAASSYHGVRRSTEDVDITVEPFPGREAEFAAQFGPEFYVDVPMIQDAIRRRSSFNLIHWPTGFKVDIFVSKNRPFDLSVMSRTKTTVTEHSPGKPFQVVSAEDIILHKLEWFRLGGEISDRQWADILGVLRNRAGQLDEAYLDHWAKELSVADLLREVRDQV